jgi:hypothetical protein
LKNGDNNAARNKPMKRVMLRKLGTVTATEGNKKVTFRYISASELKSRRCSAYEYLA